MRSLVFTASLLTLAACTPPPVDAPYGPSRVENGTCNAESAREWLGTHLSEVPSAYSDPDFADNLRVIRPGTPFTKDLRPDRLNVIVDLSDILQDAYCG